MLSLLRSASNSLRQCSRSSPYLQAQCGLPRLLSTQVEEFEEVEEALPDESLDEEATSPTEARDSAPVTTYREFLENIGRNFKRADRPCNWLSPYLDKGEGPFPMNPSFRPPPPVSDFVRTVIYEAHMHDPIKNNVRALSQQHHLSLKRIDAILRLKGMEQAWIKGKQLQTGFRLGMEKILGVTNVKTTGARVQLRYDAHEADTLEEEERRDAARQRYQRSYWESVPDNGTEPIVPASLEHAKQMAKRFADAAERAKSNEKLTPKVDGADKLLRPRSKVQVVHKLGRPSVKFVDVGGKFIDVEDRLRRMALAERRARVRDKVAIQKEIARDKMDKARGAARLRRRH